MIEDVKQRVKELLDTGKVKAFLGLCKKNGHTSPHLFTSSHELDTLVLGDGNEPGDSRYPLNKYLIKITRAYPGEKFGVLVRGCDERGLKTLYVWNQLNPENIIPVGIPCPQELAEKCECLKPYPDEFIGSEKAKESTYKSVESMEQKDLRERFSSWIDEFSKCIKCYGCRDICPMCFCKECSLETHELLQKGEIPPEIPLFHLVRAVHMAGRCIDCGLCNEVCPANIPLRTLYKKVSDIIDKEFNYRPGFNIDEKPPLNILGGPPAE